MYIFPPLKITDTRLSHSKSFQEYIQVQYGGEETWRRVQPTFEKIDELRSKLDFKKLNDMLAASPKSCQQIQKLIYDYYKYVLELEKRFQSYSKPGQSLVMAFSWTDSYNPAKIIVHTSSKFELIGLLYNLAISFIVDGMNHYNGRNLMDAVQRFNGALGCLNEIKKQKSFIDPSVYGPQFDLCIDNLEILENTCLGLGYGAFFELKQPEEKAIGLDKIACLAGEAGASLAYAYSILAKYLKEKKSPYPPAYQEKLKNFILYFTTLFITKAANKMQLYRVSRILDDTKGRNMGWAISYLEKGVTSINAYLNNKSAIDSLPQPNKELIQNLGKEINNTWAVCKQQNDQIYRDPIVPTEQLPAMVLQKEWQILTGPLPSKLNEKIEQENIFSVFLPAEQLLLVSQGKGLAQERQTDLDLAYRNIYEKRNQDFNNAHVKFFLDIWNDRANKNTRQITPFIQEKIAQFRQLGGAQRLQQLSLALKDNSKNCVMILMGVKQKLDDEANDDIEMKKGYGEKWNRMPSGSINMEYMNDFARLEQAANQAAISDVAGFESYEKNKELLMIPYLSDSELLKKMPDSQNEEILKAASNELEKLVASEKQTDLALQEIHSSIGQIFTFIDQYNYTLAVVDCVQKGIPNGDIVAIILEPIKKLIEKFNQLVENGVNMIGETCALAYAVDDLRKKKTSNTQALSEVDQIGKGLDEICNLFYDFQEGLNLYQKMFDKAISLDKRVTDFLLARSFEKNNLAQQISYAIAKDQNQNIGFGNVPQAPQSQPIYNSDAQYYGQPPQPPQNYSSSNNYYQPAPNTAPNPYNVPNSNQYGAPPAYGYNNAPGVYYPPPAFGNPPPQPKK